MMNEPLEPEISASAADADLVQSTRIGDSSAFGELWQRHYGAGLAVARSITNKIDADDLVQEAYARIFQAIRRGGGPVGAFRAYLFTTIRNAAATWGRQPTEAPIDEFESVADPATTEQSTEEALDQSFSARAFRSLPTRWQEVLWYTEVEQMKPAAVAPILGIKPVAVSQLAARAREGLREAWISAHLASLEDGSECQWVTEHAAGYTRGNASARDRKRIDAHLPSCPRCTIVLEEAEGVSKRLALVLLPLILGATGATGYLATLQQGAFVAAPAMPSVVMAMGSGPLSAGVASAAASGGAGGAGSSGGAAGGGAAGGGAAGGGAAGGGAAAGATGIATVVGIAAAGLLVAGAAIAGTVIASMPEKPSTASVADANSTSGKSVDVSLEKSEDNQQAAPQVITMPPASSIPQPEPFSPVPLLLSPFEATPAEANPTDSEENASALTDPTKTAEPAPAPTQTPSPTQSASPTESPTTTPTPTPTSSPSVRPTDEPRPEPTASPTVAPTPEPTTEPTTDPTTEPTPEPTIDPSPEPTTDPSDPCWPVWLPGFCWADAPATNEPDPAVAGADLPDTPDAAQPDWTEPERGPIASEEAPIGLVTEPATPAEEHARPVAEATATVQPRRVQRRS